MLCLNPLTGDRREEVGSRLENEVVLVGYCSLLVVDGAQVLMVVFRQSPDRSLHSFNIW